MIFYGEEIDGTSGVLSIIDRNLEPVKVYNHPSRRVLGTQIKWENSFLSILNVYAPNLAKARKKFWNELEKCQLKEWYLLGDFNMVERKHNNLGSFSTLARSKKNSWKNLTSKLA